MSVLTIVLATVIPIAVLLTLFISFMIIFRRPRWMFRCLCRLRYRCRDMWCCWNEGEVPFRRSLYWIDDHILLGGMPTCDYDLQYLAKKHRINCMMTLQPTYELAPAIKQRRQNNEIYGMLHIKRSTPDATPMSVRALAYCVATLMLNTAHERRVFIHCRRGTGRSAVVAVAYLCLAHGLTLKDAEAQLRSRNASLGVDTNANWNLLNDFLLRYWNSPAGYSIRKRVIDTFNNEFSRQTHPAPRDSEGDSMTLRSSRRFSSSQNDFNSFSFTRTDSSSQLGDAESLDGNSKKLKPYRTSVSVTFTEEERKRLRDMGFTEDEYGTKLGDEYDDEEVDPAGYDGTMDYEDPEYYEADDEEPPSPPPSPPMEWPDDEEIPRPPPLDGLSRVDYGLGGAPEEDTTHYFPIFGSLFRRPPASRLTDATKPVAFTDNDAPPSAGLLGDNVKDSSDAAPPAMLDSDGNQFGDDSAITAEAVSLPLPPPALPHPEVPEVEAQADDTETEGDIPPPPPLAEAKDAYTFEDHPDFAPAPQSPLVSSKPGAAAAALIGQASTPLPTQQRRKTIKVAGGDRVHSAAEVQAAIEKRNSQMDQSSKDVLNMLRSTTASPAKLAQEYRKQNLEPPILPKVQEAYVGHHDVHVVPTIPVVATGALAQLGIGDSSPAPNPAGRRASITATGTGTAIRRASIAVPGSGANPMASSAPPAPLKPPSGGLDDDE